MARKCVYILHIFGRMSRGGAELRTLDIMRNIDRERYRLAYCVLSGREGVLDGEIRALGGEVFYRRLGLKFPGSFRELLREGRYQVVHSHVHHFSGYVLRLASLEKVPVRVAHFRSSEDGHYNKEGVARRFQRMLMKNWINQYATHIVAVSEGAMRGAWKEGWSGDDRCSVIYNGLDLRRFCGPSDRSGVREEFSIPVDGQVIIHVGRFSEAKNHLRLVDIFSRIRHRNRRAHLLLVGGGQDRVERGVREKVRLLALEANVVFAKERADVARLLKAGDLLIYPSIWEGLPGVILEACAAGIPILASDLPGTKEIAEHFSSVRLLSLCNSDEIWATAAGEILGDIEGKRNREESVRVFEESRFNIREAARLHCMVWEGLTLPRDGLCGLGRRTIGPQRQLGGRVNEG